jgi:hypothetical protein
LVQLASVLRPVQLAQQHWEAHVRLAEALEMVLQVLLQLVVSAGRLGLEVVSCCWIAEHFQASGSMSGQQSDLA